MSEWTTEYPTKTGYYWKRFPSAKRMPHDTVTYNTSMFFYDADPSLEEVFKADKAFDATDNVEYSGPVLPPE